MGILLFIEVTKLGFRRSHILFIQHCLCHFVHESIIDITRTSGKYRCLFRRPFPFRSLKVKWVVSVRSSVRLSIPSDTEIKVSENRKSSNHKGWSKKKFFWHFQHYQDYLQYRFFCSKNSRQSTISEQVLNVKIVKIAKIKHSNGYISYVNQNKRNIFLQKETPPCCCSHTKFLTLAWFIFTFWCTFMDTFLLFTPYK